MKVDTLAPLVDVQPAYDALAELAEQSDLRGPEARAFLRFKLEDCVKRLRETAKHLDARLKVLSEGP